MHPARLVVICGLPGAGTTSRSVELTARFGAVRMSPDDWLERLGAEPPNPDARDRVEEIQDDLTVELLRAGTSVVTERRTWMRSQRDSLRRRAVEAGAFVHLEFIDLVAWSDAFERPTADELASYDPLPPVTAGDRQASASYPYGSWSPQSRPR